MSALHPRRAASDMPNNLQDPAARRTAHSNGGSSLPAAPLEEGKGKEGATPIRLVRHTPSQQAPHKSGVRSKPHAKDAVLNSAAAALHMPSEEPVVQMQHTKPRPVITPTTL